MYLNVYAPGLQYEAGWLPTCTSGWGCRSPPLPRWARSARDFSAPTRRFARNRNVPWVDFAKGHRKDDVMHAHLAAFEAAGHTEGVLFIGRAQQKTSLFRTERRRTAEGAAYPWIVRSTGVVNHFYVDAVDADFGPFFLLLPLQRPAVPQRPQVGQAPGRPGRDRFSALDNGFAAVADPAAVQAICDVLGPEQIDALLRKWLAILPTALTAAERAAGYRYEHVGPAGGVLPDPGAVSAGGSTMAASGPPPARSAPE
jgi:hypothetical protein